MEQIRPLGLHTPTHITKGYLAFNKLIILVLQQTSKKWASFRDGGPHRVTSSSIHQIIA